MNLRLQTFAKKKLISANVCGKNKFVLTYCTLYIYELN